MTAAPGQALPPDPAGGAVAAKAVLRVRPAARPASRGGRA
ncbi:hypothetical protein EDE04_6534 [Streptomyces sp. 2132.2]|nr:hypothetical protein EDE04_6534 [Streptomyces sp. 2132.2]